MDERDHFDPEQGFDEACEQFVFDVLTDAPDDWILWVLDRVDESDRNRIIKQIHSAIGIVEPNIILTDNELLVLRKLSTYQKTIQHKKLVDALEKDNSPLSERTVGPMMKKFQQHKLIDYPNGPRKGAVITAKGRKHLDEQKE